MASIAAVSLVARNLTVVGLSAAALHFTERPVINPLSVFVVRRRWGLLQQLRLPAWVEVPLAGQALT